MATSNITTSTISAKNKSIKKAYTFSEKLSATLRGKLDNITQVPKYTIILLIEQEWELSQAVTKMLMRTEPSDRLSWQPKRRSRGKKTLVTKVRSLEAKQWYIRRS